MEDSSASSGRAFTVSIRKAAIAARRTRVAAAGLLARSQALPRSAAASAGDASQAPGGPLLGFKGVAISRHGAARHRAQGDGVRVIAPWGDPVGLSGEGAFKPVEQQRRRAGVPLSRITTASTSSHRTARAPACS